MSRHRDRTPAHRLGLESLEVRLTPAATLDPSFLGSIPALLPLPAGLLDARAAGVASGCSSWLARPGEGPAPPA